MLIKIGGSTVELSLEQKQTQMLIPQVLQAIRLLQMGTVELNEYIQEQLQENPALESDEAASPNQREESAQQLQKLEWLHASDVQNHWYNREDAQDLTERIFDGARTDLEEESLYSHLRAQVRFERLSPDLAHAVECVLQSLTGTGRLDEPLSDLAAHAGTTEADVLRAIELVQGLEPAGVAARDLSECLALQLIRRGETGLALTIVKHHLEDMGQDHYNHIARATGATQGQVREACRLIRSLDPRPGAAFTAGEDPGYIVPDLAIVAGEDGFEAVCNDTCSPSLSISSYYHRMLADTDDAEVKEYLSAKVRQAKWVVQSVEQRREMLLSCARCIAKRQEDFFRRGPGCLHPLSLADAAAELGVHESTISRAVRDKYLQCSYGVFPLKYFFSRALSAAGEEGGVSAEGAKSALRFLIDDEDKRKPLSDQRLAELLAERGIVISRRTVAKYREELRIPSASGRKEL